MSSQQMWYPGPEGPERRRSRSEGPSGPDEVSNPHEIDPPVELPRRCPRKRGRALTKEPRRSQLTGEQRLLILDSWLRSGLPAGDFAPLVGVSKHTLYAWKSRFEKEGPAALESQPRKRRGGRIPEVTRRAILMLKASNEDWGCQRISDVLYRGPGYPASAQSVARVLKEAGYESEHVETKPHRDRVRRFERDEPSELWQTDIFTFVLKRQNRRVYLVAYMDDHSRYLVSYGLHASQSTALVLETLREGIASYGPPKELLTDNGAQYVTWRGKSQFTKECEKRGIQQIVAKPRRPQTLGKIERFWGTLWRECIEAAIFRDLGDARVRIGHFIDYYNFQRTHQGVGGLVPADRFFRAAPQLLQTLKDRAEANALDLARHGEPKSHFFLTGSVGGQGFSVHTEGERVYLRSEGAEKREIDLSPSIDTDETETDSTDRVTGDGRSADDGADASFETPLATDGSPPSTPDDGVYPPGVSGLDAFLAVRDRWTPPLELSAPRESDPAEYPYDPTTTPTDGEEERHGDLTDR